ncbi:MAG: hypothetical protein R3E48_20660 [Burkholderiaceae bacterium]
MRGVLSLAVGALAYEYLGLTGFGLGVFAGELAAALMTINFYLKHELLAKVVAMPMAAAYRTILGTGSVLLFLVGETFGWFSGFCAWPIAMAGVLVAGVWGWRGLHEDVKKRLVGIVVRKSI